MPVVLALVALAYSPHALERALRANDVRAPTCRAATVAERKAGPFRRKGALFTCRMTVNGERARYDVQVLGNRCFVAERHRRGRAVYGCAKR